MPYTNYVKLRIVHNHQRGLRPYTITKVLETEGIKVSRFGVHKFIIMYNETGSIGRRPGSGRISKVTSRVKALVEEQTMKRRPINSIKCYWSMVSTSHSELFYVAEKCLDGHSAAVPIASSYGRPSVWSGVSVTRTTALMM